MVPLTFFALLASTVGTTIVVDIIAIDVVVTPGDTAEESDIES